MKRTLDSVDVKILNELQKNGRISIVELAERINLTKTPCSERVKRLEKTGYISGYYTLLDCVKVDMDHVTIVHVNLVKTIDNALEEFNEAVKKIPEVQTCFMMASNFDYMLKVRTKNIAHYREVLGEKISKLPCVQQTHSYSVMENVKDTSFVKITDDQA